MGALLVEAPYFSGIIEAGWTEPWTAWSIRLEPFLFVSIGILTEAPRDETPFGTAREHFRDP